MSSIPKKNMFEIFSQGLFEGVKPMMIVRDHLVRHPDRCTHQAVCVPICPTGAWLSTPPYKFDAARCLEERARIPHQQHQGERDHSYADTDQQVYSGCTPARQCPEGRGSGVHQYARMLAVRPDCKCPARRLKRGDGVPTPSGNYRGAITVQ